MNLLNIAKHLLHLAQTEYGYENSVITADEIFASKQLFEILKSFKDSYFSELRNNRMYMHHKPSSQLNYSIESSSTNSYYRLGYR
jgi:hypothetical protein